MALSTVQPRSRTTDAFCRISPTALQSRLKQRSPIQDDCRSKTDVAVNDCFFSSNSSAAARLLDKRREMHEIQNALEQAKARFAKNEESFREKEEALKLKDQQLQHQLVRFKKFLQDNEAKKKRAELRAAEERVQIKQTNEEIRDLVRQYDECQSQCRELEDVVRKNEKYEEFLRQAVAHDESFEDIQDIVTRYLTMKAANHDLLATQKLLTEKSEYVRCNYLDYKKEASNQILGHNNRMAVLQHELEGIEKQRIQLQHMSDETVQAESQQSLNVGQILMSIENLFTRCTTKRTIIQHHASNISEGTTNGLPISEVNSISSNGGTCATTTKTTSRTSTEAAGNNTNKKVQHLNGETIRRLCVVTRYVRDFRSICDTLAKEKKQRLKSRRPPSTSFEESEDAVEFVHAKELQHRGCRTTDNRDIGSHSSMQSRLLSSATRSDRKMYSNRLSTDNKVSGRF